MSTTHEPDALPGFADLGLDPRHLAALMQLGYEEPTPVQRAAIPPLLAGRDVIALAATGTGKTAAFALPLLHRLDPSAPARERTRALVLVPTRELAMQVAEAVHRYGRNLGVVALPLYGGASMEGQIRALKRGVDVVVATPGRALDHLGRKTLVLDAVTTVVLDEADEMLDMGFADDIDAILARTPKDRQTALFSATLAPRIAAIADRQLRNPHTVRIERPAIPAGSTAAVTQLAYIVSRAHKMAALGRVLDVQHPACAIVFCRTRTEVDELTQTLGARGYRAEALHGGLSQDQRDRVMKRLRAHKLDLLIATDVAARGLDVQHVSHVVNYDVPTDVASYVHRIGRTGRAGRAGVAITFAEPREHRMLRQIQSATRQPISIEAVPTAEELHHSRREALAGRVRTTLRDEQGDAALDPFRELAATLAEEFGPLEVAAAALRLAQGESLSEEEIPNAAPRDEPRTDRGRGPGRGGHAGGARGAPRGRGYPPDRGPRRGPPKGR